jgi:hypothetical protein
MKKTTYILIVIPATLPEAAASLQAGEPES